MNMYEFEMRHMTESPVHHREVETVITAAAGLQFSCRRRGTVRLARRRFFTSLPPRMNLCDKFPIGFYNGGQIAGIADVVRGWNAPHKAIIGLLLLMPACRGSGVGRQTVEAIDALAHTWTGVDTLRIAVIDNNDAAFAFWRRMGFAETGERRPVEAPFKSAKVVLEKRI